MTISIVIALAAVVAAAAAGIAVLNTRQQHALTRANQITPDRATRAPRAWAVGHDPEAKLHRRLRDALAALRAITTVETGTSLTLRVDLEQSAIDLDDHLVAVAHLPAPDRAEQLSTITAAVECIERGVAHYAAAALPDATALHADLTAARNQLDTVGDLRRKLES